MTYQIIAGGFCLSLLAIFIYLKYRRTPVILDEEPLIFPRSNIGSGLRFLYGIKRCHACAYKQVCNLKNSGINLTSMRLVDGEQTFCLDYHKEGTNIGEIEK